MMIIETKTKRFSPRSVYQNTDTLDYGIEVAWQPPTLSPELASSVCMALAYLRDAMAMLSGVSPSLRIDRITALAYASYHFGLVSYAG